MASSDSSHETTTPSASKSVSASISTLAVCMSASALTPEPPPAVASSLASAPSPVSVGADLAKFEKVFENYLHKHWHNKGPICKFQGIDDNNKPQVTCLIGACNKLLKLDKFSVSKFESHLETTHPTFLHHETLKSFIQRLKDNHRRNLQNAETRSKGTLKQQF